MKVIIFGKNDMAQLAKWYLENDSKYTPVAFCVDAKYLDSVNYEGLPVIAFEEVHNFLTNEECVFFAPIYATNMNRTREEIANKIKAKGYRLISYVNSKSNVSNAKIGENCFIFEYVNLQPFTEIGNNVVIWSQSHIGHHSIVKSNNFISGHVVVAGHCVVDSYCFLASNTSYREKTNIAEGCFIGMGSTVLNNTAPWSVYIGTPAKIIEGKKSTDLILK